MKLLYYLLEANLYLAVFYGFYFLLLKNETFYTLNRYYLLLTSLLSFILPLLQIGYLRQLLSGPESHTQVLTQALENDTNYPWNSFSQPLSFVYFAAAGLLSLQLIAKLTSLIYLALKSKKHKYKGITYVELTNSDTAFSFFNLLFMQPSTSEKEMIVKHEMVHIRQRHSLDILLFELIQILNWFNPVTWFLKKEIKLVHEYIADDLTTRSEVQKHDYALFLIQNSLKNHKNQLTNQIFNPSILKRRIMMLDKEKSGFQSRFKFLLALPIIGGMLCYSTVVFSKDYAMVDLYPQKSVTQQDTSKKSTVNKQKPANKPAKKYVFQVGPPTVVKDAPLPPPLKHPNPPKKKGPVKFPPPIVVKDAPTPPAPKPPKPAEQ